MYVCLLVSDFKSKRKKKQTNFVLLFSSCVSFPLMKISFFPSPSTSYVSTSSSLTSSSSSTLDTNLNNNNNNNNNNSENVTTKCFSSIIRRFLCSGNLRTHPFDSSSIKQVDPVVEFVDQKDSKAEEKIIQATPGLVARLMGLDSMPDSFGRSRSVNSMDCRLESDKTHGGGGGGGGHRRAKTCLSFRERPTFLELENDEFLLLSFENVGEESKKSGGSKLLSEMGSGELKQQKKVNGSENRGRQRVVDQNKEVHKKRSNKRNFAKHKQDERKISSKPSRKDVKFLESASPAPKKRVSNQKDRLINRMNLKEVSDGSKLDSKNKDMPAAALKQVEPQYCNLDNSSPVSVLDIDDFEFEQGSNSSEDESRKQTAGLNLISKLTPGDVADRPSIHITRISIGEVPELRTVESQSTSESEKAIDTSTEEYIQLWGEVCKLTEQDMKTLSWMPTEMLKMEELDEIGTGFGLEILNQLLHEITAELEQLPTMAIDDKF